MATALAYRFLIATRPFVRKFSASHHQARLAGVEVGRHLVFFQSSPWFRSGSAIVGIPTRTETIKTDIFATSGMTMFSGRSFSSSTLNSKGEPEVALKRRGATESVACLTLNKPESLNALSLPMIRGMFDAVKEAFGDPGASTGGAKVLVLRGAGGKAFCAGGDVKAIAKDHFLGPGVRGTLRSDFFREEYELDYFLAGIAKEKALVSLWDGVVMGGGVGISIHGTLRVATETTLFAMPETVIGLFPDVGSAYVLSRLPGGLGLYLGLTGARLRGDDLLHCGLATHFVPRKRLPELEDALAADDGNDPGSVVQSFASEGMSEPRSSTLAKSQSWINADFSGAKSVEEIVQRLQARLAASGSAAGTGPPQIVSAECSWARETLQSIGKASPTALKVAHRHIAWAETATLKECFERDFRVIQNLMAAKDFGEGVRARLVDKDNCPAWVPPTLEGVSLFSVDALFSGIGKEELVL